MFDAFVGGAMTLIVLFLMLCGAVLLVEAVPLVGIIGIILVALVTISAIFGFVNRS